MSSDPAAVTFHSPRPFVYSDPSPVLGREGSSFKAGKGGCFLFWFKLLSFSFVSPILPRREVLSPLKDQSVNLRLCTAQQEAEPEALLPASEGHRTISVGKDLKDEAQPLT